LDPPALKYWAFISYSHGDSGWADWLHQAIETYRVPSRLQRPAGASEPVPRRLYPVFRDRDELPSAPDLSARIRTALSQSRCLIAICSPRAAASRWVDQEIRAFQELGRGERVLALIVDGAPKSGTDVECFPPVLRAGEPLAADVRPGKDSREAAKLKIIAGMLGVGLEELRQRERQRVLRRRLRTALAVVAGLVVLALAYVGIADEGLALPGAERLRHDLDRYHLSVFRPVRGEPEVEHTAEDAEAGMIERMHREWLAGDWQRPNPTRPSGPKIAISPWVTSQAMWAVLAAIQPANNELPDFIAVLDAAFAPDLLVEANGRKFGWLVSDADFPQAEPTLWTLAALATVLGRGSLLDPTQQDRVRTRLAYTEQAADTYRPVADGGWNMFPQQDDPAAHTTYATALAALALLELRHAKLGWQGDAREADALLRATVDWIVGQFDAKSNPPGWHAEPGGGAVADGLTLQIYAELLRCEEEAGIALPDAILKALPDQIDRLLGRPLDYPIATASYTRIFTNFDGMRITRWQNVSFTWMPWAIDVATRWLRRLERSGGSTEAEVQVQRVLGYLVVDLGSRSFPDAESGIAPTYVASEMLHALATVTSPDKPAQPPAH
jgi:hypothetical protein